MAIYLDRFRYVVSKKTHKIWGKDFSDQADVPQEGYGPTRARLRFLDGDENPVEIEHWNDGINNTGTLIEIDPEQPTDDDQVAFVEWEYGIFNDNDNEGVDEDRGNNGGKGGQNGLQLPPGIVEIEILLTNEQGGGFPDDPDGALSSKKAVRYIVN